MIPEAKELFAAVETNHKNCYVTVGRIMAIAPSLAEDTTEAVDMALAVKQAFDLAEDTLKTLRALKGLTEKLVCTMAVRDGAMTGYETAYCKVTPKVKMAVSVPARNSDPEKFLAVMRELGIPESLLGDENSPECARLHYPGVVELASKLLSSGAPLPAALASCKQFAQYSLRITPRKGVLEE